MQATAPSTYRWAYFADVLGDEHGLICLGWVTFCDAFTTVVHSYSMRGEVVSLPNDATIYWGREREVCVSTESVLWNLEVHPVELGKKEKVPAGQLPPELAYKDFVKPETQMPGLVAAQMARTKAMVLQNAKAELRRTARYHQSKARRDKHKQKMKQQQQQQTPSPIKKKHSLVSRRTNLPSSLKGLIHAIDMEELPSSPLFLTNQE